MFAWKVASSCRQSLQSQSLKYPVDVSWHCGGLVNACPSLHTVPWQSNSVNPRDNTSSTITVHVWYEDGMHDSHTWLLSDLPCGVRGPACAAARWLRCPSLDASLYAPRSHSCIRRPIVSVVKRCGQSI
eukprot:2397127-Rhodomonas_salina.1